MCANGCQYTDSHVALTVSTSHPSNMPFVCQPHCHGNSGQQLKHNTSSKCAYTHCMNRLHNIIRGMRKCCTLNMQVVGMCVAHTYMYSSRECVMHIILSMQWGINVLYTYSICGTTYTTTKHYHIYTYVYCVYTQRITDMWCSYQSTGPHTAKTAHREPIHTLCNTLETLLTSLSHKVVCLTNNSLTQR